MAKANPHTTDQLIEVAWEVYQQDHDEDPVSFRQKIVDRYENKYGSGVVLAIFLKVVVPILVELFLEWIKEPKEGDESIH